MVSPSLPDALVVAMLESAADGIAIADASGTIVHASAALATMLGWARDELLGQPLERLLPAAPDGARDTRAAVRRDGTTLAVEVRTNHAQRPEGSFTIAIVRELSDRQKELAALAHSEAWLRELIDQAPDGILVTSPDGRYTEANDSICRMLGYTREELIGRRPADVIPPDELARLAGATAQLLAAGGKIPIIEWTFLHKDGSRVETEINARVLADGRRQAFVRDIRDRKRTERELRLAEQQRAAALRELAVALEQCPANIVILRGPMGEQASFNRAAREQWANRSGSDMSIGRLRMEVAKPDGSLLAPHEFPAARALRGETVEHERIGLRSLDGGNLVPFEINAAPLRDEDDRIVGAIAIAWEVSAVVELERLRAEWNSVVAHDLRQPIQSIGLVAQMIRRHAQRAPELIPRDVEVILELTAHLSRMTSDLLDLSRLDASRLSLDWRPVELVACIQRSIEHIELQEPGMQVALRVEGPIPVIEGDAQRIAQVVDNLLSNAMKYRRPGSPIRVTIGREGERVAVAVTNEGPGIAPADLQRLFQRFERLVGATQSGAPGLGLGLQITRGLVEAHGGEIEVRSVPGEETTFRFTLPLQRPAGARSSPAGTKA